MSGLEDKAVDILDKLDRLTEAYAPEVIDKAVQAVMVSGIGQIISAIAGLIAAFVFYKATFILARHFKKLKDNSKTYNDWIIGIVLTYVSGAFLVILLVVANIGALTDIWVWTAVFNPELALAHKVLGL